MSDILMKGVCIQYIGSTIHTNIYAFIQIALLLKYDFFFFIIN